MNYVVIPARWSSSRLPGKPLKKIGSKPMIQWVYESCRKSDADFIFIATDSEKIRDQVLKFNGTKFVPAAFDATFVFTIADFDMNDSTSPQLIGSGSWKSAGTLQFTASYNNGPPDGFEGSGSGAPKIQGYVNSSISSSYDMFPLSSSFSTGTNPMAIDFPPNSSDDIRFRLFASAGSDTDNEYTDQRIYFRNQFVYGDLSVNNGFTQANIRTLAAANTITNRLNI